MSRISRAFDEPLEKPPYWPIRDYCEAVLGRRFGGWGRVFAHCPFTSPVDEGGGKAFVIDEAFNNATCFGQCDRKTWTPFDLHREVFQFPNWKAALADFKARLGHNVATNPSPLPELTRRPPPESKADRGLIAKKLAEQANITAVKIRNIGEDGRAERELVALWGEARLAIAQSYQSVFVGETAKRWLRNERLARRVQFLCCWSIKEGHNWVTNRTVEEPIMLDIEFDDEPEPDNQLRLIWALRKSWRMWKIPLFSICWSAGKSYHALFYVRGCSDSDLELLRGGAARLGACEASMRPHQWVRFPGGWRPGKGRQSVLYLKGDLLGG
jgi:hypothetical protein